MVRTVNDAYLDLRNALRTAGISGYHVEAQELICYALDIPSESFHEKRSTLIFDKDCQKIDRLLTQRLSGVPVQYITGHWEFYSLNFDVSRDTLIPRADTETLVEAAINVLSSREHGRFLDLCCGCGCVGISVLKNLSDGISGVLADKSIAAIHVARRNIVRHFLSSRAYTVCLDALLPAPEMIGKFNFIACNPPYIPTAEIAKLDREVQKEPRMALDGGEDGLNFYRVIPKTFKSALARGGTIAFEVGAGQCYDVIDILERQGYRDICTLNDLTGIERVVMASVE